MLAKGIQLTIMIGPVVPIPVPQVVMDALDSVEITTAAGSRSGFQMTLQCNSRSALNQIFVIMGAMTITPVLPALRVMFIVTLNGTSQPLFDGVLTHVEMQPGSQAAGPAVTVTGEDLCSVMDRHRLERPAVSGHADRGARGADLRQICAVRDYTL